MNTMLKISSIFMLLLLISVPALAQTTGDYRSAASGKWGDAATWQRYSGTAWVTATTAPTGVGTITVMAGDSIDVNSAITITGRVINGGGKFGNAATNLTFGNGGIYEHAVDGGSIPVSIWGTGSTCLLTGIVGSSPTNTRQDFYNFSWNCPGYGSSAINLGWGGNTIKGDLRIIKGVSTKTQVRLTSTTVGNTAPGANVITINGSVYIDDYFGVLTATGSSGSDTIAIYVKGNIVSSGTINLGNGSGAQVNWYLSGNITINGGAFTTHSAGGALADTLVFVGNTKQTFFKVDSVASTANVQYSVRPGSTVDLSTTAIGGTTTSFKAVNGTSLLTAHIKGLKGNLNVGGGTVLGDALNIEYNGSAAQLDSLIPATVKDLKISNPSTVEFSKAVTVNGVLTLRAGVLKNDVNAILLGPSATVLNQGGTTTVPLPGGVTEIGVADKKFAIKQNYPNPFNPSTMLQFSVPVDGNISVKVYNTTGQEVANVYEGFAQSGKELQLPFNAGHLPSGIYLARLQQGNNSLIVKMVLMK